MKTWSIQGKPGVSRRKKQESPGEIPECPGKPRLSRGNLECLGETRNLQKQGVSWRKNKRPGENRNLWGKPGVSWRNPECTGETRNLQGNKEYPGETKSVSENPRTSGRNPGCPGFSKSVQGKQVPSRRTQSLQEKPGAFGKKQESPGETQIVQETPEHQGVKRIFREDPEPPRETPNVWEKPASSRSVYKKSVPSRRTLELPGETQRLQEKLRTSGRN